MKRIIACLLSVVMILGFIPIDSMIAIALEQEHEAYSLDNGYIRVQVSKENGGFVINTVNGDTLKKSDNNKKLLFHTGEYDTSFVSFRVTEEDGTQKDFIFGGKYGDSSDPSHKGVTVTQATENSEIIATWSVESYTFTQIISLANESSNEHGMVSLSLSASNNSGNDANIKARVLLDTALGGNDFGTYQAVDEDSVTHSIYTEQILDGTDYPIPQNFYCLDNIFNTSITAFSVNSPQAMPYQVAFGHWNNLAASLFDFTPDTSMDFTKINNDYLTADSAYALYYDMGNVGSTPASMVTYYGVYSHKDVPAAEKFTVDVSVPLRLELNDARDDYVRQTDEGVADFTAGVTFENYVTDTAENYENLSLVVRTTENLRSLGDMGAENNSQFGSTDPFIITYTNVNVGDINSKTLYFQANVTDTAAYERITIGIYDTSETQGAIVEEKKLGEKVSYILLPSGDGSIPNVSFTEMTPKIIYSSGTRHLYVTVKNATLLDNRGNWNLVARSVDGKTSQTISHEFISIKDGVMDVAIDDSVELAPGSWYLQLEWTDAAVSEGVIQEEYQKQTATCLNFTVSEDIKYKNDSYGILTVVKYKSGGNFTYKINSFRDEEAFNTFKNAGGYDEILLIFRGEFSKSTYTLEDGVSKRTYYTATSTKNVNEDTREYEVDNCVNINGAMDFENGKMSVYYEKDDPEGQEPTSDVIVEFDGELLTSNARTSIWTGKSGLTRLEQGKSYSLVPYDKNGVRDKNFNDNTIMLVWPTTYSVGQTIAGMVFNMAFGELGVMKEDNGTEIGRVISFSAKLDLSFTKAPEPSSQSLAENPDQSLSTTYWQKIKDFWSNYKEAQSVDSYIYTNNDALYRTYDWSHIDESGGNNKEIAASVMVRDILYGCGQGFVGVNFKVEIGIKNYIAALPKVTGTLEVNTINDWSFKFDGSMSLARFSLEAKLSFKSRNDVPVPDDIYFYIGGFDPGINIDGCGVVWIKGGGGGISDLYDTIFMTDSVPPLKLILTASFSIVQVLDGKATLSVGATGISLKAEDLKIFGTIEAIKKISLGLEWYPGIDLQASISVNLFNGVIQGGGYIVLIGENYTDWFFEMFAHASINVPESIPVFGGMTVAGADLGISTEKIWGNVEILSIRVGIAYYWGDNEVDFGTGDSLAKPSFPSLLGHEDVPVYYDDERDQTLYARFGTNIAYVCRAELLDTSEIPRLLDASISSSADLVLHKFNLGNYTNGTAAIVQINYDAASPDEAKQTAQSFKVNTSMDMSGNAYNNVLYDGTNMDSANTNITFDSETGKASYAFTVTDADCYDMDWYISTGTTKASVILYNVDPLPELTSISGTISGNELDVTWSGIKTNELDKISFYLSESNDPAADNGGRLIEIVDDMAVLSLTGTKLTVPADMPSGEYYLRAVYSKEDAVNSAVYSTEKITFTNSNMPKGATISDSYPAGNLELGVIIAETDDTNTTGYTATVYNEDGTPTDVSGLNYDKAVTGETVITIGGSYTGIDEDGNEEKKGLVAGKKYMVGVTPYCLMDTNGNGENDTVVYGDEVLTGLITMPEMTTPEVTIQADAEKKDISESVMADHDNDPNTPAIEVSVTRETYTASDITFTASVTENVTGEWGVDGGLTADSDGYRSGAYGTFTDTASISVPLKDLSDGRHTLTIRGKDNQGDGFQYSYRFDVDTTPPRLMLSSPLNGSTFSKDGKLTVSGVTDYDAIFTITSDGTEICSGKTVEELGGNIDKDGIFNFTVDIYAPNDASQRDIVITAADAAGNVLSENVSVTHGGLAELKSVKILVDGNVINNGNIPAVEDDTTIKLSLAGVTEDGTVFKLTGSNITWRALAVEGDAYIDADGNLEIGRSSHGIVEGGLEVTKGAYITDAVSFGAATETGTVTVISTVGGTVTGGGRYSVGDIVKLTATPDNGYSFEGWEITGAEVSDTSLAEISFVMPDGAVSATAKFKAKGYGSVTASGGDKPEETETDSDILATITAEEGEFVTYKLTKAVDDENKVVAQYSTDGGKTYKTVAKCAVIDGVFTFIAPYTATYRIVEADGIKFDDVKESDWAYDFVDFASVREIVSGIGNNLYDPEGTMTRAMFVTMLGRIHGNLGSYEEHSFSDVEEGSWYEEYVSWASHNGIIKGYDAENFGPDDSITREQICAMLYRYILFEGCETASGTLEEFTDHDLISDWASESVSAVKGFEIIKGYEDGSFRPQGLATRAEAATMFTRLIYTLLKNR